MRKLFLLITILVTGSLGQEPTVEIKNGLVKGVHRTSYGGNIFSAFEGIPYAQPPIGELRFQEAQPLTPWFGIWIANTTHACTQFPFTEDSHVISGQEDCLYLNVYVLRVQPNGTENLSVVAFIHSGAFMYGFGHLYRPDYLMDRELVYVSINYRLGPFGFLSTEDDDLPGNLGLKDQVLALKWIQANIAQFGGNPKSVTLTGISAGGASVQYHYISPLSHGLFHRGFSQSGTTLAPWALQKAPRDKTKRLASIVGCNDEASLIKCLRQRSTEEIVKACGYFYDDSSPLAPFGPVIERTSKKPFLPNHPYHLLQNGIINNVPWITSVTTEDGIFPGILFVDKLDYIDKNWNEVAPNLLDFNYTATPSQKQTLPGKIKEHYFGSHAISKKTIKDLVKLLTDRLFLVDAERAARQQASAGRSPVYFLLMGFKGQRDFQRLFPSEAIDGVAHGDDGFLYPDIALPNAILNEETEKMKDLYLDMIVEFSRSNVPKFGNVKWRPISKQKPLSYLFIEGPDNIKMEEIDELGAIEFWNSAALMEN